MTTTVQTEQQRTESMLVARRLTTPGVHPYDTVVWETKDVEIVGVGPDGEKTVVFFQPGCEFPEFYSERARQIIASKYFRYPLDDPRREWSLREVCDRIVGTIAHYGTSRLYFANDQEREVFEAELTHLMLHQVVAFNSPVWFNCGVEPHRRPQKDSGHMLAEDMPPVSDDEPWVGQSAACFLLSVEDAMSSIQEWIATESQVFRGGSGAGVNLSAIREDGASLSRGGTASGPVSFMRWADSGAGSIKSGGGTRRAAKMVVLDADHPDIREFVWCKAREEEKAYALGDAGYDMGLNGEAWRSIQFQNANNSVRLSDAFFAAVEADAPWGLVSRGDGRIVEEISARELFREIAEATWQCGDPGVQYDDTIQRWHTTPNAGPITTSNPCSEFLSIDNSACNLASINLMKVLDERGQVDGDALLHACQVLITAQDILVDPATYPTQKIGEVARAHRQLGLGYANLGATLMTQGLAYDSDEGRKRAQSITALMHAAALLQSARLAERVGAYQGFAADRVNHERVVEAQENVLVQIIAEAPRHGETADLLLRARHLFRCVAGRLIGNGGLRNSHLTVIAPTGTISFAMDCDTTGCEPAIALSSHKTLVGGGSIRQSISVVPRALTRLGYSAEERDQIEAHIAETGSVVGCDVIRPEHLAVFDTAFSAGGRAISSEGHVRMLGAIQPFLSGAASKTVNLPNDATVEDVMAIYRLGHTLGLKAIAVYRDGSKRTQPLTSTASPSAAEDAKDPSPPPATAPAGPVRRKLPITCHMRRHKFTIAGVEGYLMVGEHEDGSPGELFIKMAKQGSTVSGLTDNLGIMTSLALQYGVPLSQIVTKLVRQSFEPQGITENPEIRFASSLSDYIGRWLAGEYLDDPATLDSLGINRPVGQMLLEEVAPEQTTPAQAMAPAPETNGHGAVVLEADGAVCPSCGRSDAIAPAGRCRVCTSCGTTIGGCS